MDSRLEKALEFANFRQTLSIEKTRLTEILKSKLKIYRNGGYFQIDRNLIVFLNLIHPTDESNSVVLLDDNFVPVLIEDLTAFRVEVTNLYHTLANQHFLDMNELKKKRSVKAIVDL